MTILVDADVEALLEKIAYAKVQHPVALTRGLIGMPISFVFSVVNGIPTVRLQLAGTHEWPYTSEPSRVLDDRTLA